jgi:hypothetical protein
MRDFLAQNDPRAVGKAALGVAGGLALLVMWRTRYRRPPRYGWAASRRPTAAGACLVAVLSLAGGLALAASLGLFPGPTP